ncbi:MAG TPA: ATP-binding protein, partial [Anaerolineales bacterium]
ARTSLAANPLTQPLLNSLRTMDELNGSGLLLDENSRVLYGSQAGQSLAVYDGPAGPQAAMRETTAPDGTRQLVYYQPVSGRPWAVVLSVPAQQAQQLALNIALPLSAMVFLLALLALIFLRVGLRLITSSLGSLAVEANRISQGSFDHPLATEGADEIGQLGRAFEQMRLSLQARLGELNRLLFVSQRAASSLELEDALRPVLEAMMATGAACARVVLEHGPLPEDTGDAPVHFSLGPAAEKYAHLDDQVLRAAQDKEHVVLPGLALARDFALNLSMPNPAALLAVPLRRETRYYGALWAAYEQPRAFPESEVRFATTLAGQAALAVSNAYLFQNVLAGRRQLEAILNSTSDPVLVTDHRNRLILSNHAANQLLGLEAQRSTGQPTERVIQQRMLFDLLHSPSQQQQSAEIVLQDNRTYLATASTVHVEGRPVGRVCILRDVTRFKELDSMKSDFVATVSHDLRSPLTLMRGYASMLPMAGGLNDQQQAYLAKIISGVDNMTHLVNNLLDLGRIEVGVGLQMESVPVLDIVERVTGPLQQHAADRGIRLSVELPRDMPHAVEADAALLQQALYNLVENGIKYTPSGGSVDVRVRADEASLTFEVADTGIGIPASDLPRLFEKFHRGSQREARARQGTGLGLAIVNSIAARHGGRVWVESRPGKGSTFFLQVPLSHPRDAQSSSAERFGL